MSMSFDKIFWLATIGSGFYAIRDLPERGFSFVHIEKFFTASFLMAIVIALGAFVVFGWKNAMDKSFRHGPSDRVRGDTDFGGGDGGGS